VRKDLKVNCERQRLDTALEFFQRQFAGEKHHTEPSLKYLLSTKTPHRTITKTPQLVHNHNDVVLLTHRLSNCQLKTPKVLTLYIPSLHSFTRMVQ